METHTSTNQTATLRLHCQDVPGIVYNVSRFIYENGGNIINAEQHAEAMDNRFFMRVHFDCGGLRLSRADFTNQLQALARTLGMETALSFSDMRKRMAIMVSRYNHCL